MHAWCLMFHGHIGGMILLVLVTNDFVNILGLWSVVGNTFGEDGGVMLFGIVLILEDLFLLLTSFLTLSILF